MSNTFKIIDGDHVVNVVCDCGHSNFVFKYEEGFHAVECMNCRNEVDGHASPQEALKRYHELWGQENSWGATVVECSECDGSGEIDALCGSCNGSGEGYADGTRCMACGGGGAYYGPCEECNGTGKVEIEDEEEDEG